jgi:hypothetical protein
MGLGGVNASAAIGQLAAVHDALLRAGLAWAASDNERAAGELDDVAVLAADLAADLRAADGEQAAA